LLATNCYAGWLDKAILTAHSGHRKLIKAFPHGCYATRRRDAFGVRS